jgi:hypothetical protein
LGRSQRTVDAEEVRGETGNVGGGHGGSRDGLGLSIIPSGGDVRATVIASLTRAGEELLASWLSPPTATAMVTPLL